METKTQPAEIVKRDDGRGATQYALTSRDIVAQAQRIQEIMKLVMKNGTHYGTIPGCPKPSLFKPGAEKIAVTFRIAVETQVEDLSAGDIIKYRVTARATGPDGTFLGSSMGECSSNEEKFKWRKPACQQEYDQTDPLRRRMKWFKGRQGGNPYAVPQVRTEPEDVANTILQMADKRAFVAVIRKVTAASDIFTQDIQDLPEGMADPEEPAQQPIEQPRRASEAAAPAGVGTAEKVIGGDIIEKVKALLIEACDNDHELMVAKLVELTTYTKGGQKFEGKTSLKDCSTAQLKVVYGKLQEQKKAAMA